MLKFYTSASDCPVASCPWQFSLAPIIAALHPTAKQQSYIIDFDSSLFTVKYTPAIAFAKLFAGSRL